MIGGIRLNGRLIDVGTATKYAHPDPVAVTEASTLLVDVNKDRVTLAIQNTSTVDVWLNLAGGDAVANKGFKLASGDTLSMNVMDFDLTRTAVYAIRVAAEVTCNILVTEGTV